MRMHKNILGGGGHLIGTSGALVGLLIGEMRFPTTPEAVHAEETGTKATLTINPVLSLGLDSAVTMSVQPTSTGEFTSGSAELTVSTNNETGYSLYLSTANGKATLDSINPATTTAVQPVSGNVAADDFGANTWGYNLDKGAATDSITYQAVPTTATAPQATTAGPTLGDGTLAADTYSLNFGALINSDLPSGTYTNTVTVSVVANPAYVPNLTQISNMQDMTTEICNASTVGQTNRLTDTRDGKLYWVAKLADNQCWMTQNLDLDLGVKDGNTDTAVLTPADSDVSNNWMPPRSTEPAGTITSANTDTETYSWDLGMYVKSDPDGYSDYCGSTSLKSLADSTCRDAGWTDVSSMTPMADGASNEAISGSTYNAHYLVGNLYQWNAATAGTGGADVVGRDATDSICPKGWQLPTSNNSNSGSFQALMTAYSISNNTAGSTAITQSPLYFHPSGNVNWGSLRSAGSQGRYWSSTAYSSASNAYDLAFESGAANPSNYLYRYRGFSVRCLAR